MSLHFPCVFDPGDSRTRYHFVDAGRGEYKGIPNDADFVVEVVSAAADGRRRDRQVKFGEYAAAGIAESWIIDPENKMIIVNHLVNDSYDSPCTFHQGHTAVSQRLPAFSLPWMMF